MASKAESAPCLVTFNSREEASFEQREAGSGEPLRDALCSQGTAGILEVVMLLEVVLKSEFSEEVLAEEGYIGRPLWGGLSKCFHLPRLHHVATPPMMRRLTRSGGAGCGVATVWC